MTPKPSPPPSSPIWCSLAGEDSGHFDAVTGLADRVCQEELEWFTAEARDRFREWRTPDESRRYWKLSEAFKGARDRKLPVHGHFDNAPGAPQAAMFRAQLLLWQAEHISGRRTDVAVLVRDSDRNDPAVGAEQAIAAGQWPFKIILAVPIPEVEAWNIVGFTPETSDEQERVKALRSELGFSPIEKPERLTSSTSKATKDAKRVLEELTAGDPERKRECLDVTSLEALRQRGKTCGLSAFLDAVRATIVPLLSGAAPST